MKYQSGRTINAGRKTERLSSSAFALTVALGLALQGQPTMAIGETIIGVAAGDVDGDGRPETRPTATGGSTSFKIGDNESPRPTDRVVGQSGRAGAEVDTDKATPIFDRWGFSGGTDKGRDTALPRTVGKPLSSAGGGTAPAFPGQEGAANPGAGMGLGGPAGMGAGSPGKK